MQWYNPKRQNQFSTNQNNFTEGNATTTAAPQPFNRQNPNQNKFTVGNLQTSQLEDPSLGFGSTFQGAARRGSIEALQGAQSSANPEDYAAMNDLRNYFRGATQDLPGQEETRMSLYDSRAQRGLTNLLNNYRASNAGTGLIGSRQYGGGQGDIVSRATLDYMQGLGDIRSKSLQDALSIQNGLGNVYGQDLKERAFQLEQAKTLSNALSGQQSSDLQREGTLPQKQESNWVADVLPVVGAGVGAAFGNPMAGMAIGSAAGGAMKGGQQSGGNNAGYGLAQALNRQPQQPDYSSYWGSVYGQPPAYSVGRGMGYYGG